MGYQHFRWYLLSSTSQQKDTQMNFDNNSINDARNFARKAIEPLKDGWYTVRLISARWYDGTKYSRMSFRFGVVRFDTKKVFNANITWGVEFVDGELVKTSDASSQKKLAIIAEIVGAKVQDEQDPESWAAAINECAGAKMGIQIKHWSTEKVPEGYNLIQVRKV